MHAYGWSLPGSKTAPGALSSTPPVAENSSSSGSERTKSVPVPVPVYCRPLAESSPQMKIWCGAGANLNGGITKDGGCMVIISFRNHKYIMMRITVNFFIFEKLNYSVSGGEQYILFTR